ncbi:HNH endonuclease signature motif containing protein [Fulvivirga lutea]|uniref:HNH endonuclease n=1 Tax=Fulvivirga lutea TaxID=2810512 RepID=A0A974WEF0_9BACT|nr:HNH endonuclease signature motif containing protein [Fulvivirga lutea]QSE96556.1 HNH endonuclease [Fulvivirga lutea]
MIYDFLKGKSSEWLESKLLRKLKTESHFNYAPVFNATWNKIKVSNSFYYHEEDECINYMFAYKNKYATEHWGHLPRFHIAECEVRQQYSNYVFASQMPVGIYCTDKRVNIGQHKLELCSKCNKEITLFSFGSPDKEWFDVILDIASKKHKKYVPSEISRTGYTKDWGQVSYARRAQEDFTCEGCKIQLLHDDAYYLEVHHKNRKKEDNRKKNLKVLCIECHSEVDDLHRKNYSQGDNALKLSSFKNRFRN